LAARDGVRSAPGAWFKDEAVVEYTLFSEEYEQTLTVLTLDDAGGYDRLDEEREEDAAYRFSKQY
jgi:hypothetical protein